MMFQTKSLYEPVAGGHRRVVRPLGCHAYRRAVRAPMRALSEKLATGTGSSPPRRIGPSSFGGLSNILCFWRSSDLSSTWDEGEVSDEAGMSDEAGGSKAAETSTTGATTVRQPVLLRMLLFFFRLLPYAIRSRIGFYRWLEPRNKRKRPAGKNTLISRHCVEYVLNQMHPCSFDPQLT